MAKALRLNGDDTYEEKLAWIVYGQNMGWCSPPVCETHDGMPLTEAEDEEFIQGYDPCITVVRLYDDQQHRKDVEEYHSASLWRKL